MNRMTLQELVNHISEYDSKIAYKYLDNGEIRTKTYRQLTDDSKSIASYFAKKGINGCHIAILGRASVDWISVYLGITISGNVAVPLDKMLPSEEICTLMNMGDVEMLFASAEYSEKFSEYMKNCPELKECISFSDDTFSEMKKTEAVKLPQIEEDTLSELIFTSGTTGTSKGVMLSHKNLASNAWNIRWYQFNDPSPASAMSVLPIHHTFELTVNNLAILVVGETICINDSLENIIKNIQLFRPSVMLIVPMMADLFAKKINDALADPAQKKKFETGLSICRMLHKINVNGEYKIFSAIHKKFGGKLRKLIVGGAPLRDEVAETLQSVGFEVYQGYGMTETAPVISTNSKAHGNRIGSVGQIIPETEVRIKDGEIQVKGPSVMLGYYKNPEATAEAFDGDWLRSGDLGRIDEDGFLYITGRKKNLIILDNGKNIYPEELEEYLNAIPCVKESMVYERKGKICAMLQLNASSEKDKAREEIRRLNANMPTYKKINGVTFRVKDFPKTTTMKIKRNEVMKEIELSEEKHSEYKAPQNEQQKRICTVFETVLGKSIIGITDDFFEEGGDSLKALEAAAELGIQAQEIYDYSTPEKLSASLNDTTKFVSEKVENINSIISETYSENKSAAPKHVLLTGATGYLGSHILRELLLHKMNVVCLARNPAKLESILKFYFPRDYKLMKYQALIGDIEKEHLGLEDKTYKKLCSYVDTVIHTAANVHHTGHYEDFERSNVLGTQHVIDFCKDSGAFLHHTSTASVSGAGTVKQTDPQAIFSESVLDIGQHYQENVYIHSKYRAEEKVILARQDGLRTNIYRIGNLTWRFKDGLFQKNSDDNGFVRRCRGLMKVGVYCSELDVFPIDFTPVDLCASAYVKLVLNGKENQIYHMLNPNMFYIKELKNKLRCALVPKQVFEKRVLEKMPDKDVAVLSFYSAIASASDNIEINCDHTVRSLKELGFKWPKIKLGYLKYLLKIN